MNDKGRQEKKDRNILIGTQGTYVESEIRDHAESLALDMNLRLVCEMLLSDNTPILWVESVCVTDIIYPQTISETEGRMTAIAGFFRKMFHIQSSYVQENANQRGRQKPVARSGFFRWWLGHDKR